MTPNSYYLLFNYDINDLTVGDLSTLDTWSFKSKDVRVTAYAVVTRGVKLTIPVPVVLLASLSFKTELST